MAAITIPLYYDLDLLLWTSAAGGIARQPNLVLGQSDSIAFAVQFVRSGVVIELTSPAWICGIKPINDTAGDYLCQTTTGVKTGSTTTTVYTFTLLLDSTELRAWLLTVTAVSNYAAFSIRDTVNLIATLPAITCTILPDYTLEGTTPTDASGTLIVDSGQTFTVHKSFAMPTTDGFNNYVLKTDGAGVGSWAADSAGTGTVTSVSVTTANGVSGTVATSTTTPAITLTLGAITPTTGAFSDTTDATSSTSAPLKTAGGMAVAKSLYVGGFTEFTDNVDVNGDLGVHNIRELGGTSMAFSDQGNNPTFEIFSVADSVNYVAIEPSLTTLPVHIYAQGTDANIGLHLQAKGTGFVNVQDGTTNTKRLRFDVSGNSSSTITTLASSSTTSQTITLPNATGATTLAGLQMTQSFTAANTFSLTTDATSSTAGAVMISGGLAVAKKLYVGTTLFLSNGHRVTFFTSTTTTAQPTLYGTDGGGGQGTITFGSFGADGTTPLYGGINGTPALINCYSATLTCSYVAFQPSGGLKDSGGNIALTVTSNKAIAMGGTLAVTGNLTCGNLLSTPETVAAVGSSSATISTSFLITAISHASIGTSICSLANGTTGQIKIITATSISAGNISLSFTLKTGFTSISMTLTGNSITLVYVNSSIGWMIVSNYGCTIV